MEEHDQNAEAHPLFFDSLFPSFQSTTPETAISDYRQRKRADSSAEHDHDDSSAREMKNFSENNVEFYAEVIGKLIGTVRDGFTSLIDDVKQRNSNRVNGVSQKLKNYRVNETDASEMHHASTKNETRIAESVLIQKVANGSLMNDGIQLATTTMDLDGEREHEKIQSGTESSTIAWNGVIQVIAKKNKQKRSESSQQQQAEEDDEKGDGDHEIDVKQFGIPIDSDSSDDDDEMTNESLTSDIGSDGTSGDKRWFTGKSKLIANLSEKHRRRKENLIKYIHDFLTSNLSNETTSEVDDDSSRDPDLRLSFAVMRGNSTIIQLSPKQFLRMFHRGSDEHALLQLRAKTKLQRAFYKYARLYLLARKGYKDARSFNRMVRESQPSELKVSTAQNVFEEAENEQKVNEIEDDDDEAVDSQYMTSDARRNVQAVEAFAIFILEIFGAMLGLTLGAIGQIQAGFIFDT